MSRYDIHRRRSGFTLAEMMIAITLTLLLFAAAIPFFRAQTRALDENAGRSASLQNVQFAANALDRDLRIAGVGVTDRQPMIVFAHPRAVVVNVDLVTPKPGDVSAVYPDPDVPDEEAISMTPLAKARVPFMTYSYPDSAYWQDPAGKIPSSAETIAYWVELDSTAGRGDQYVLWRRVNNARPRVVSKGIILESGEPVFRYFTFDSLSRQVEVPQAALPYFHSAPIHGNLGGTRPDTGNSARTDSLRAVRMRLVGLYRDAQKQRDVLDTAEVHVRVMNAGLQRSATCGESPLYGGVFTASYALRPDGSPSVALAWTRALDESGGEQDVERYEIYRRRPADAAFGQPLVIVPGGYASYTHVDLDVQPDDQWVYGVTAIDCTPSTSAVQSSGTVTIP
ncbi:MAG TPA: prepilin-type N-terminal cleavage/methylation domain-containing protein [Gemmatimonadaceae bacterium]|nr:prepilin-type N-terminal cleavage/methylation domain-containing protein [Gemmatimonadaceae bacterium]